MTKAGLNSHQSIILTLLGSAFISPQFLSYPKNAKMQSGSWLVVGSITVTTIMFDSTLVLRTPRTDVTYCPSRLVAVHLSALRLVVRDDVVGKEDVKYAA